MGPKRRMDEVDEVAELPLWDEAQYAAKERELDDYCSRGLWLEPAASVHIPDFEAKQPESGVCTLGTASSRIQEHARCVKAKNRPINPFNSKTIEALTMVCNVIGTACKIDLNNTKQDEELQYYLECMKVYQEAKSGSMMQDLFHLDEVYLFEYNKIKKAMAKHHFWLNTPGGRLDTVLFPSMQTTLKELTTLENNLSHHSNLNEVEYIDELAVLLATRGYHVRIWEGPYMDDGHERISYSHHCERPNSEKENKWLEKGCEFRTVRAVHSKFFNRRFFE